MAEEDSGWCTIESSPAVFTEILEEIGVQGVQVEEPYSLDTTELQRFGKVHGIIFLFRYRGNEQEHARSRTGAILTEDNQPHDMFFANQVIQNACATQAILSIILNISRDKNGVDIGDELNRLKQFTVGMDSMTKGLVLSNSEKIREAHNSFSSNMLLVDDPDDDNKKKQDAFHFVSYIPWERHVYELDGLQKGPRDLGQFDEDDDNNSNNNNNNNNSSTNCNNKNNWISIVAKDVYKRVEEYASNEIRFGLLLVTEDQRSRIQMQLQECPSQESEQANLLRQQLLEQNEKRASWKRENARRKWNFMPFIVKMLKLLAETGHIENIIDKASEKKKVAYQQALRDKAKQHPQQTSWLSVCTNYL